MIFRAITLAAAIALFGGVAFAQTGSRDSSKSGAPAVPDPTGSSVTSGEGSTTGTGMGGGIGASQPSADDASNSGAPTAAGVNSEGHATEPGAVKRGANGR
jgi:hypothetical protein